MGFLQKLNEIPYNKAPNTIQVPSICHSPPQGSQPHALVPPQA